MIICTLPGIEDSTQVVIFLLLLLIRKQLMVRRILNWHHKQYLADAKLISASLLVYDGYVVADKYINDDMPFIENPLDKDNNLACRSPWRGFSSW